MARLPLDQGIPRLKDNEERVDLFVNGDENTDWRSDDGSNNPSIRKLVKIINTEGEGWLAEAEAAAVASSESADNAAASESVVQASAQAAANSAAASAASAGQASTSAGVAQGSAQNSADSASVASTAAGQAAGSAGAAQGSAQNAADSATAASASAGQASTSAGAAQGSAQNASNSAAAAATSAGEAAGSASDAEGFAQEIHDAIDAIGDPVSYAAQTRAPAQQKVARNNIGITVPDEVLARLNTSVSHPRSAWVAGTSTVDGPLSPADLAAALDDRGDGVPIGTVLYFTMDTVADGFILADGSAVTSLYPEYRQLLLDAGAPFGMAGSDPLRPQLLGEFIRGWDGDRGVDAGRVFGSAQGDAIRNITGMVSRTAGTGLVAPTGDVNNTQDGALYAGPSRGTGSAGTASGVGGDIRIDASRVVPTADDNRPRNVALLPMIKAFGAVENIPGTADMNGWLQQASADAQASVDAKALGVGQQWQYVTASRTKDVVYQNTTGRPISVGIAHRGNNSAASSLFALQASDDGTNWFNIDASATGQSKDEGGVSGVIPPDWFYRYTRISGANGTNAIHTWAELK